MDSWVPNQVFDHEAKMMNGKLIDVLLGVSLVVMIAASDVSARQVVTQQDREWAEQTVKQEKALQAQPVPNSVAILYFTNKTELDELNPIQKGLAIMLITDLAKVEGLRIVERARLEALVSEINLGREGLTEPADKVRMGKFLRAEHAVGGDLLKGALSDFKVNSSLLDITQEEVFGNPQVEGKILFELFKMEKELLFEIVKELKIKLTPEQEDELRKPLTTNLDALLAWFAALEYSDRGDYTKAYESAQQACSLDPGLCGMMDEIREEINVAQAELDQGRPEDPWETSGTGILPAKDLLPPDNIDDPTDRNAECVAEDYVPVATTCGVGACSSTGLTSCVGGRVIDSCVDGLPVAETCGDVVDNDCNGAVDEGCSTPPVVSTGSIDIAHGNIFADPVLAGRVDNGEFVSGDMAAAANGWGYEWTGAYTPGVQAIGVDIDGQPASFLHPSFHEQINADPYLAYAVQLEEDQLNRQILETHAQAAQGDLLATINNALTAGDIRSRDDLLMQQADAQAGRVLRDRDGNWVRTQQYILRPDNQTVQMLNVSLRGGGAQAGLSTIDWTTSFRAPIPDTQSLRDLPWSSYLSTMTGDPSNSNGPIIRYVVSIIPVIFPPFPEPPDLASMSVRFTNPSNEYLQESRTFAASINVSIEPLVGAYLHYQQIMTEQLASSQWPDTLVYGTDYSVVSEFSVGINPGGFAYLDVSGRIPTVLASVSFHALGDANTDTNIGESSTDFASQEVFFQDIWEALRVNEPGAPDIGDNNLEIVIDGGLFNTSSIDTVYIPLSRMLWK